VRSAQRKRSGTTSLGEPYERYVVSRPRSETELVKRAQEGDKVAFAELIEAHQNVALRLAWLLTGSAAEAEDSVQNGFVKAFYGLHRFRVGAPVRPWLLQIVANEAREGQRSARRRARLASQLSSQQLWGDAAPSPQSVALAGEERARLLAAVARLSERYRSVIVCRYFLDLSERETATVLSLRQGTVKSRCSRALERLRKMLEEPHA
jgi:RNA polymerase sigma factor (sigma-70 family)